MHTKSPSGYVCAIENSSVTMRLVLVTQRRYRWRNVHTCRNRVIESHRFITIMRGVIFRLQASAETVAVTLGKHKPALHSPVRQQESPAQKSFAQHRDSAVEAPIAQHQAAALGCCSPPSPASAEAQDKSDQLGRGVRSQSTHRRRSRHEVARDYKPYADAASENKTPVKEVQLIKLCPATTFRQIRR